MEIRIDRRWKKAGYTISKVYVDGKAFGCEALEDTDRGLHQGMTAHEVAMKKIYGQTAIPTGTYNVIETFSRAFKKKLPLLENVTGFAGVRIHAGNTNADTLGCILIGRNTEVGKVTNSRVWTEKLLTVMREAWRRNEKITIKIG